MSTKRKRGTKAVRAKLDAWPWLQAYKRAARLIAWWKRINAPDPKDAEVMAEVRRYIP